MKTHLKQTARDQNLITLLREATAQLHQSLHEHPVMVELLQRTSAEAYRNVLQGFLMFYESAEPALVESASRLGVADLYPEPVRTRWLMEDLELPESDHRNADPIDHKMNPFRLTNISQLVGCVYVIQGSALGGRSILNELSGYPFVEGSSRFFTGAGEQTPQLWREFQQFANDTCRDVREQQAAILSARQTFVSIRECLTRSWNLNSAGDAL